MRIIFVTVTVVLLFLLQTVAFAGDSKTFHEIYLFTRYETAKNSETNEYIDYNEKNTILGAGVKFEPIRNFILDFKAGIGNSDTDIALFYKTNILGKEYSFEKKLNYDTKIYLVEIDAKYRINKNFYISTTVTESKNTLKRNSVLFKVSYQF